MYSHSTVRLQEVFWQYRKALGCTLTELRCVLNLPRTLQQAGVSPPPSLSSTEEKPWHLERKGLSECCQERLLWHTAASRPKAALIISKGHWYETSSSVVDMTQGEPVSCSILEQHHDVGVGEKREECKGKSDHVKGMIIVSFWQSVFNIRSADILTVNGEPWVISILTLYFGLTSLPVWCLWTGQFKRVMFLETYTWSLWPAHQQMVMMSHSETAGQPSYTR